MLDISTQLTSKLSEVLPTYYDLFLDEDSVTPCISYFILSNIEEEKANSHGYSRITVCVKVWASTVADIVSYNSQVDDKIAELGPFTRQSVGEQRKDSLLCSISNYSILLNELYNNVRYL